MNIESCFPDGASVQVIGDDGIWRDISEIPMKKVTMLDKITALLENVYFNYKVKMIKKYLKIYKQGFLCVISDV